MDEQNTTTPEQSVEPQPAPAPQALTFPGVEGMEGVELRVPADATGSRIIDIACDIVRHLTHAGWEKAAQLETKLMLATTPFEEAADAGHE